MLLNKVLALSLCSATLLGAQVVPGHGDPTPTISSSATSEAKFTPDRATVSISVQTKAPTAAAAATENARKQNSVLSALRGLGMTNDELSTTGYSVNPEYRYAPNTSPILTGYTVTNTVLADVHDLKLIGKVLDTALANGSNVISSLDFYSSNTDVASQQALTDAVVKARSNAGIAAKAAGGSLGALLRLVVSGGTNAYPPPRPIMLRAASVATDVPTPINAGQQTVSMSVAGEWRFVPNP